MIAAALGFVAAAAGVAGVALLLPQRAGPRRPAGDRGGAQRALRLLAATGRRAGLRPPRDLEALIVAAGVPAGLGSRELMAVKLGGAIAGGSAALLCGSLLPGRLGLLLAVAAPAAGFLAPDLWLRRLAAERARRARRELPTLLDLLRVTVAAGSGLPEALREVGERAAGPLAAEWCAAGREIALGVPQERALEAVSHRLPLPEVRAVSAALDRARRHGAPLAETLSAQARDARAVLRRRVQEDAARAGPKIQLVVALLLVPSVLLLVAAALAAALIDSGGAVTPI